MRLPGAGGAPEIAASCGEVIVIVRQSRAQLRRACGLRDLASATAGPQATASASGFTGRGPAKVITDLGVLEPDPQTSELTLTSVHEGIEPEQARAATGWPLAVAEDLAVIEPPTQEELDALRELLATQQTEVAGG